jgi:membrane dipeptidase
MAQVVKNILYIGNLIGFEHVGVGTDLDGISDQPEGFEDATRYPDLVAELLRQGVSDDNVSKIVGRNILRVWAAVDAVAAQMQADGERAIEDEVDYDGPYLTAA